MLQCTVTSITAPCSQVQIAGQMRNKVKFQGDYVSANGTIISSAFVCFGKTAAQVQIGAVVSGNEEWNQDWSEFKLTGSQIISGGGALPPLPSNGAAGPPAMAPPGPAQAMAPASYPAAPPAPAQAHKPTDEQILEYLRNTSHGILLERCELLGLELDKLSDSDKIALASIAATDARTAVIGIFRGDCVRPSKQAPQPEPAPAPMPEPVPPATVADDIPF